MAFNRLLYIGEAAGMRGRVANHERLPEWKRQLKAGEVLCFNAALISPEAARQRAEAAMIFKHKPPSTRSMWTASRLTRRRSRRQAAML